MRTRCSVCGGEAFKAVLERRRVPILQNVTLADRRSALGFPRGDIALAVCSGCGFVFNRRFREDLLEYGAGYVNTQAFSPAFRKYLDAVVERLRDRQGVRNSRIVDIGCGDGTILKMLVGSPATGNRGIGFDPAYVGARSALRGRARFEARLFGVRRERVRADVVLCRQVIEHLADPLGFLVRLRDCLAGSHDARLFFETSCIDWIFRRRAFHDIYYEHCSLFGPASFAHLFRKAGFKVNSVWHAFGGAYLWIEATMGGGGERVRPRAPVRVVRLARAFRRAERATVARWSRLLANRGGRIGLWGAGAKGVTFANLVDPAARRLDCVIDINPAKRGRFLAGTGHPIIAPADIGRRQLSHLIVTNPNYVGEVRRTLAALHVDAEVMTP